MFLQGLFLGRTGREVAIEVETAFAHRAYPLVVEQGAQAASGVGVPVAGLVGVDAGGGKQPAALVEFAAKLQRLFAVGQAGAGDHHLHHPGGARAGEQCFTFRGEAGVGQIDADIDELHGAFLEFAARRRPLDRAGPAGGWVANRL